LDILDHIKKFKYHFTEGVERWKSYYWLW